MKSSDSKKGSRLPVVRILFGLLISLAWAIALAFVYALLIYYSPFLLLNVFLAFLFGGIVGATTGFSLKNKAIDSHSVYWLVVPVVVGVAFYVSWAIFIWWHGSISMNGVKVGLIQITTSPRLVWWYIQKVDTVKTVAFRGKILFEAPVWVGHLIEVVVVCGTGLFGIAAAPEKLAEKSLAS